jgi:drug/metabolite transporter superfamily protein YnfA
MLILKTFVVFVIAGHYEIGGGYLIWASALCSMPHAQLPI